MARFAHVVAGVAVCFAVVALFEVGRGAGVCNVVGCPNASALAQPTLLIINVVCGLTKATRLASDGVCLWLC